MKKLRVAFCLRDMQMGGVESVLVRTLDKFLERKNIEVSIITYADVKTPLYREYFDAHPQIKMYSLYPCKWLGTELPHFFIWRIMILGARKIYRDFKRLFVLKKFRQFDVLIDYHDFGFHDELRYIKCAKKIAWFHSSINTFVGRGFIEYLKYYDKLVVLTDDFKKEFTAKYPRQKDKIIRIYNPINIEQITEKSLMKNPINGKYFCCISRLTPDKDIETIIRAFDSFYQKNKRPDIKMVFVGDGNRAQYYKSVADALPSNKQFVFVGVMPNPFGVMRGAIANILSSFNEGLPTVLMESMAVGTINIASNCKFGPREVLLDGDAGLLFEPGDAQQLSQCMDDVYNKKVDVKKMAANATKSLNRFNAGKIVDEIISLIS